MSETKQAGHGAVAGPVEPSVRPRAWAIFADNGNARMWSTLQPHVQKLADAEGLTITPLYDQAALDAAVAAERERWQSRCAGKSHYGCQYLATCGSVCNKCGTAV